jgi:hypothetical protein
MLATLAVGQMMVAQTSPSPAGKTLELDQESTNVMSAIQTRIKELPAAKEQEVLNTMRDITLQHPNLTTPETTPSGTSGTVDLLNANPRALTLSQKTSAIEVMIEASNQSVQQVVIGGPQSPSPLDPTPIKSSPSLDSLATALNSIAPRQDKILSATDLAALVEKQKSIGRILWTYQNLFDKGDPMWQIAGTGFVTSPGIVTTACHVVSKFGDVSGGQVKLKANVVVRIDFSNTSTPGNLIPITGIIAISNTMACDAAQLGLSGSTDIVPLRVAPATSATKRILVVGYPQLDNYRAEGDCQSQGTLTATQFCIFANANPTAAKVVSPGGVLTACCGDDHGGVSVITYDAPTDGGQSGSPVFDAETLQVIGVHYCCTEESATPTILNCETWHPQKPGWNEAVTTQSLLRDSSLKDRFSDVATVAEGVAPALRHTELPVKVAAWFGGGPSQFVHKFPSGGK